MAKTFIKNRNNVYNLIKRYGREKDYTLYCKRRQSPLVWSTNALAIKTLLYLLWVKTTKHGCDSSEYLNHALLSQYT